MTISCDSDLAEQANQFIVDSFAENLNKFVASPSFDNKVRNLKHHYFMDNPLQDSEKVATKNSDNSIASTVFSFSKNFRVTPAIILLNVLVFVAMVITGVSFMSPDTADIMKWGPILGHRFYKANGGDSSPVALFILASFIFCSTCGPFIISVCFWNG